MFLNNEWGGASIVFLVASVYLLWWVVSSDSLPIFSQQIVCFLIVELSDVFACFGCMFFIRFVFCKYFLQVMACCFLNSVCYGHPFVLTPFVKKMSLSPWNCLFFFFCQKNLLSLFAWIYFWAPFSVPLIHMSVLSQYHAVLFTVGL